MNSEHRHLVIAVHGIRTYGAWQYQLEALVRAAAPETEVWTYRYGWFSLVSLLLPPLRWIEIRRFRETLRKASARTRIDVVAHSFGTYLVAHSLCGRQGQSLPRIHTLILAGSMLRSWFKWRDLIGPRVRRVVNDCGIDDYVLIPSQLFVWGAGMAGRTGFYGIDNETLRNRFFLFGHSGYFEADASHPNFMRRYWLPLLLSEERVEVVDERSALSMPWRFFATLLNSAGPLKVVIYALVFCLAPYWVRITRQENDARRLAEQAMATLGQNPELAISLAIDAFDTAETKESRDALLAVLERNPRLRMFLARHGSQPVYGPAVTADGNTMVYLSEGTLNVWNTAAGGHSALAPGVTQKPFRSIAVSRDGARVAAGTWDGEIAVWDTRSGPPRRLAHDSIGHKNTVWALAFSNDGRTLASAGADRRVILWSLENGTAREFGFGDGVSSIAFGPDGMVMVAGIQDGCLALWKDYRADLDAPCLRSPSPELEHASDAAAAPRHGVLAVALSPDGREVASSHEDGELRVWNLIDGQDLGRTTSFRKAARALAFDARGEILAAGCDDGLVYLLDAQTLDRTPLIGHTATVRWIAFGKHFSQDTLYSGGDDGRVIAWDAQPLQRAPIVGRPIGERQAAISSLAFSPGGSLLASGSADGTIRLCDMPIGHSSRLRLSGHQDAVTALSMSPRGLLLASAGVDDRVLLSRLDGSGDVAVLWDRRGRARDGSTPRGHRSWVRSVAFSPDGRTVASGSVDRTILLWDTSTLKVRSEPLTGHHALVRSVAFSPDGKTIASAGADKQVLFWQVEASLPLARTFESPASISTVLFSPDGRVVAYGAQGAAMRNPGGEAVLADAQSGAILHHLKGHARWVSCLSFTADGRTLASGGRDGRIVLWDVGTGRQIGLPLVGHKRWVRALAFSPSGNAIVSGGGDGILLSWDVSKAIDSESWKASACRILNAPREEASRALLERPTPSACQHQ